MRFLRVLAPVLCVFLPLWAVETQVWEHSESADFEKGTLHKLSLSSEGRLTPAPIVRDIYDPSVPFLWTVARDSKGNVDRCMGRLFVRHGAVVPLRGAN